MIKDIMHKDVKVVSPDTLISEVAKKMLEHDCGSVIVGEDDRLIGIITDRDLTLRAVAEGHPPLETAAEHIMTEKILYCFETDEVTATALNMTKNKVRRLVVLDKDKRLAGIISLGDLAAHSEDYQICGKALGLICAEPAHIQKRESHAQNA